MADALETSESTSDGEWDIRSAFAPTIPNMKSNPGLHLFHRHHSPAVKAFGLMVLIVGCVVGAAVSGPRLATLGLGERRPSVAMLGLGERRGDGIMQQDAILGLHSALGMLTNPDVHNAATANIMRIGNGLLKPEDQHLVRSAVATGFLNISSQLHLRIPELAKDLVLMTFNDEQKNAVVSSLKLTTNHKLLTLGERVGKTIHESGTIDRMVIRQLIEADLQPRSEEIHKLRSELLPLHMREALSLPSSGAHSWELTLDPENVQVMGAYSGGKFVSLTSSQTVNGAEALSELPSAEKTYGILGGVLEEGRALLDILKSSARLYGRELDVPAWVTELGGNMDVSSQELNCEHHFASDSKLTFMKAILCPLKFGTQGLDALRAFQGITPVNDVLM